jgi:hypothetical protein
MVIMACPLLKTASKRKAFITFFNISMLIMALIGIAAGGFSPFPYDGFIYLAFVAMFNIYVFLLQFLFVPTRTTLDEYENE